MSYIKRIKKINAIIEQPKTLTEYKELIKSINDGTSNLYEDEMIDNILQELGKDIRENEVLELYNKITNGEDSSDFYIELDGEEYRFIHEDDIRKIYEEEIKTIVEDCYNLNLEEIPSFIAFEIDWESTAENCLVDGYGHTFSGYDGSEVNTDNYYIFRTN